MRNERKTQDRVIRLLSDQLSYTYLGNLHDQENTNIRESDCRAWLRSNNYSDAVIDKALFELKKSTALNPTEDLYPVNKSVYEKLRYGLRIKDEQSGLLPTVWLIDWKEPLRNHFAIAEEVTVKGERTKRPDIVIYVNGIALGVLELKRAGISVSEGIRQNLDNQQHLFIKPFFSTIQTVLAGNDSQGLYYGTIKTPEKFFLKWKEDNHTYDPAGNILDQHLLQFCEKRRFLELIHDFVVYDAGIKKLCRPNQYFGVREAQRFINRREGGIIWHTQGSGKSLTMVWLAKWIRENQQDARLLIITDRTELDGQIEAVFTGVNEQIHRTSSGQDLVNKLNETTPWLLCSLIHKFGVTEGASVDEFISSLRKPANFKPKGNLFIFIDECHRTQSGELHKAMKALLPDALFIGFTGTPILKSDKKKSIEIFGSYIHTYKFNEAVEDGVVLDLLYEARDVDQRISDQKGVDEWFDEVTRGMNDLPKAQLKEQWGKMQRILSTRDRLQKIAFDIIKDFRIKPRLKDGRGNAMLVTPSIYEACRYYVIFQEYSFRKCAIITSYEPSAASIRGEATGEGQTQRMEQYDIYQQMLNGRDRETFEREVKKQFVKEPANMQLLIVVDKLLTGFDAPSCTYLYIDKEMRDHGLFQAICRVNRTENDDKEFGYIVDYKNLFNKLNDAISDYTSDAFDSFDEEDVKGLLVDRLKKAKESLDDALEAVYELTRNVEPPREIEQYIHYFLGNPDDKEALKQNEEKRLTFYKSVVSLVRAYNNIAPEMEEAGYNQIAAEQIKRKVDNYVELRNAIKIASDEYIDLKQYEPDMRQLLDMYLSADPSRTISNFGDASLLQIIIQQGIQTATDKLPGTIKKSKQAVAETLAANMRKVITQEMPINPIYYERMSVLLEELIRKRKSDALSYEAFLKEIEELAKNLKPEVRQGQYPAAINTPARQALYEILQDEALTVVMDEDIAYNAEEGFVGNLLKERKVRIAISRHISDEAMVDKILELVKHQKEYRP